MIWTVVLVWYSLGLASIALHCIGNNTLSICQLASTLILGPIVWIAGFAAAGFTGMVIFQNLYTFLVGFGVIAAAIALLFAVTVISFNAHRYCVIVWRKK